MWITDLYKEEVMRLPLCEIQVKDVSDEMDDEEDVDGYEDLLGDEDDEEEFEHEET